MTESSRPYLMPADTPDYMVGAWVSCMSWAIRSDEIRDAFFDETGKRYAPPQNQLDAMIDRQSGYINSFVEDFIKWANINVWGAIGLSSLTSG